MTLSGNGDRAERAQAARDARRARQEASETKRPWLFPVVVAGAVLVLVFVVYMVTLGGAGR